MNIIFGSTHVNQLAEKYVVLELDTFIVGNSEPTTSYCVVEKIPLSEFNILESTKKLHSELIFSYRNRDWQRCEEIIELLMGKWNGELDSFYETLQTRIQDYRENPPDNSWTGTIFK